MVIDPMGQLFTQRFMEIRPEAKSLEPLIDYLALLAKNS